MSLLDEIKKDTQSQLVRQQVGRFVRLGLVAFGAQLAVVGTAHLTRDVLASLAVGAVETAYRQWAPTVPWAPLESKLAQAPAPAAPSAAPAQPPAPGA